MQGKRGRKIDGEGQKGRQGERKKGRKIERGKGRRRRKRGRVGKKRRSEREEG